MERRIVLLFVVGCLILAPLFATGQQEKGDLVSVDEAEYTIGIFVKDNTTPFWRYVVKGAVREAEELGVNLKEYAPQENTDVESQINQVEDAIQSGIDAICIAANDSEAIIPALDKAVEAGIPIITFNSKVDMDEIKAFVGVDNYQGSYDMTEQMITENDFKGNLVIMEGPPAAYVNQIRVNAVTDLVEKYSDVNLLTRQTSYARREEAMSVMENLLTRYDNIDMIWNINDASALGCVRAIEGAGVEGIDVAGFDGTPEGIQAVIDGRLTYSLDQGPFDQGGLSIRAAVDVLNGVEIEEYIPTGGVVIDKSNAKEMIKKYE